MTRFRCRVRSGDIAGPCGVPLYVVANAAGLAYPPYDNDHDLIACRIYGYLRRSNPLSMMPLPLPSAGPPPPKGLILAQRLCVVPMNARRPQKRTSRLFYQGVTSMDRGRLVNACEQPADPSGHRSHADQLGSLVFFQASAILYVGRRCPAP